jgi:hypothetical protein
MEEFDWVRARVEWRNGWKVEVWEQRYHDKTAETLGQNELFKDLNGEKNKSQRMIDNNNGIEGTEGRKKKKRKAQGDGLNTARARLVNETKCIHWNDHEHILQ